MKKILFTAMMMLNVVNILAQDEVIASIDLDELRSMRSDKYVYLQTSQAAPKKTCTYGMLTNIEYKASMIRTIDLNEDTTYIRADIMFKDYEWLNIKFNKESSIDFVFYNQMTNEKVNVKINFTDDIMLEDSDIDVPEGFKLATGAFMLNDTWKMMYNFISNKDNWTCTIDKISLYDSFVLYEFMDDIIMDKAEDIKKQYEDFEVYEVNIQK